MIVLTAAILAITLIHLGITTGMSIRLRYLHEMLAIDRQAGQGVRPDTRVTVRA